ARAGRPRGPRRRGRAVPGPAAGAWRPHPRRLARLAARGRDDRRGRGRDRPRGRAVGARRRRAPVSDRVGGDPARGGRTRARPAHAAGPPAVRAAARVAAVVTGNGWAPGSFRIRRPAVSTAVPSRTALVSTTTPQPPASQKPRNARKPPVS